MKSETAQDIFRLFDMSGKTEEQIMDIMKASHYSPEACCLGITFLKKESSVLMIMEKTAYNEKVCEVGVKALNLDNKTDNQILALLEEEKEKDTQENLKKLCIPYFNLKQKKEYEILNLLKKTSWDYSIKNVCMEFLKAEKKTDDQLIALMELTDYQEDVCAICIKHFKNDQNIVDLMVREETPTFVQMLGAPRLNWKNKTTEQIMNILVKTDYNSEICLLAIPFIKTVKDILLVIKYNNHLADLCKIGIANLKLSEKTKDKLLWVMKESEYSFYVCEECIKFLNLSKKNDKQLLLLMSEAEYAPAICAACIIHLELESDVHDTIKKTNFDTRVCLAGLPRITLGTNILNIFIGCAYDDDVCILGLSFLQSEELIFSTMERSNYAHRICDAAVESLKRIKNKE